MIVRSLGDVVGTERDVTGPGWNSRRLLLASDGMGFSMTDTVIKQDAVLELEYTHHLEACYCIEGRGQIRRFDDLTWHALQPFTLYALDQHDRHLVQALDGDLRLVCVFNPPLTGGEVHREDGSYAPIEA
ncbi:ectoine synthase [Ruegeria sp. R14_0]|uniref:ectoine synthase n=1 Tax=Ruegeria sp. R14_0 TaxID=2821100 RepID=UPI001ADCF0B0|nr:ectoine synthase [Ruegeria sp. R14_0]MBO9446948.1 ectoine synthase [Ruegeria sp. R14_0]